MYGLCGMKTMSLAGGRLTILVPEGADGHVRSLWYEDHGPGGWPPDDPPVHRPQPGQDAEEGGLPAPIRTGYEHMLTRPHLTVYKDDIV